MRRQRSQCRAFTLLEVILALAILGLALATLGAAVGRSHQNARRAADQAELCFAAASLLDEVIVGARPLTAIDSEPVADALDPTAPPVALVSLRIENGPLEGVLVLYASARPDDPAAGPLETVDLVRWVVDPALTESASSAASSSTGASGSTGTGGSSSTGGTL
jgi:prepilin-type N-terminal cleavage/methylation domain-containing protein